MCSVNGGLTGGSDEASTYDAPSIVSLFVANVQRLRRLQGSRLQRSSVFDKSTGCRLSPRANKWPSKTEYGRLLLGSDEVDEF